MELFIRNKWISLTGSSIVKDANENDVLKVQGRFFSITQKKFIYTLKDEPLYMVRNKFWSFFVKKAYIYDKDGNEVALIKRKFFSMSDHYIIESKLGNLEIKGNILGFNYHISLNGVEVGHIARRISLRDSFVLTVNDNVDYAFYVALILAIDNITDRRRENARNNISFDD